MTADDDWTPTPDEAAAMVLDDDTVPCESCLEHGVIDGHVCAACDGFGWREP